MCELHWWYYHISTDVKSSFWTYRNNLQILKSNGIKCKKQKCKFFQDKITYLGRQTGENGILPDESAVRAVKNLNNHKDVKEVEAFISKVNYYHNFVRNLANFAAPINVLHINNRALRAYSQCKSVDSFPGRFTLKPSYRCLTFWHRYGYITSLLWWQWTAYI